MNPRKRHIKKRKRVKKSDAKVIKIFCLFQTMKYILHGGTEQTPLTTMVPHSVFARDRSKTQITKLNHIGPSKSYAEVKKDRELLMAYTQKVAGDDVPLPSTFTKTDGDFTMACSDNSNYLDRYLKETQMD